MRTTNVKNVVQEHFGLKKMGVGDATGQTKHIPHNNLKKGKMPILIVGVKTTLNITNAVLPAAPIAGSGIFIVTDVNKVLVVSENSPSLKEGVPGRTRRGS